MSKKNSKRENLLQTWHQEDTKKIEDAEIMKNQITNLKSSNIELRNIICTLRQNNFDNDIKIKTNDEKLQILIEKKDKEIMEVKYQSSNSQNQSNTEILQMKAYIFNQSSFGI